MTRTVRIEPAGAAAERAAATVIRTAGLAYDPDAQPGQPLVCGAVEDGEAALRALVRGAELALDDVDVRLTVRPT